MWSTVVAWVDDGFTLVDIQSLARDLCDLPLWVYDGFTLVDIQSLARDLHELHFWVYDGFTLVDIQSLARDFMWSTLVSLWWILTLVDIGSLCKGFTWPTPVSLWWIFTLVDIQSLAIEAPMCIQSSYKVCTLCVLQDPVVGFLKWCKIYFMEFPHPSLKQILPQIWPFGPLGRLDLYGI